MPYSVNTTLDCSPAILVSGGIYKTQNSAFEYTIRSLQDPHTGEEFSTSTYNGTVLKNCGISTMGVFVNYFSFDANFEVKVRCILAGNMQFTATTNSLVSLRTNDGSVFSREFSDTLKIERTNSTASTIAQLLLFFGLDFFAFLKVTPAPLEGRPVATIFSEVAVHPNHTLQYLDATWSAQGYVDRGYPFTSIFNSTTMIPFENFVQVLWSAVLFDLGGDASLNVLTDVELFKRLVRQHSEGDGGTGVGYVLNHLSESNLPFNQTEAVPLNARYLCRRRSWKTPTNLFVDVLVATSSLFLIYWNLVNFVLRCFATRSSPGDKLPCLSRAAT
ncbi:hypothetical protein BDV93DRAFT_564674 [Ceratobasidium sp. AG-I]|nr:hypothetical protein BDV93DRAFT_564674 [Ceratobasidium sp. AG-I]